MPHQAVRTTIEYRLGQLDGSLEALVEEVRGLRDDFMRRFEQHDARDDERFGSHGRRLDAIERKGERDQTLDEVEGRTPEHRNSRRNLIHTSLIAAAAAMIGGALAGATGFIIQKAIGL